MVGAVVSLTTTEDENTPAVRKTDERGAVTFGPISTTGIITAMTATAFAAESVSSTPTGPVSLVLDAGCAAFDGVVRDQSATSATPTIDVVHIYAYGTPAAPAFSTSIDETGRFKGCLPNGRYYVGGPLDAVGGGVLFELPGADTIEYVATRDVVARTEPPTEPSPATSLEEAVRAIPKHVGVVALGESTHGTAEFALERARFTVELARTRKVRFVLLEASLGETLALDQYVRNGTGDLRTAVTALRFWMWDTEEFIRSMELIRAFNRKRPANDRIGVLGTDVQMGEKAVAFLLADGAKTLSSGERAALAKVPDLDDSGWKGLSNDEQQNVRAVLARLARPRHADDMRALAAASLVARLDLIVTGPELEQMRVRDRLMAEMTMLLSNDGEHLSVVWAHMSHITKRWMFGQETMGGRLQARLGAKYFALAMLGVNGSTRSWDSDSKVGVIPHVLDDAPDYSVEGALSNDEAATQYVLFSRLPPGLQEWISKLRYVRFIGSRFPKSGGGWALYDVGHGFDGAVIFPTTTSTTPTPTGVRKAKTN